MKKPALMALGGIVVAVVIALLVVQARKAEVPLADNGQPATQGTASSSPSGTVAQPSGPGPVVAKPPSMPAGSTAVPALKILTPALGEAWAVGATHAITWSGPAKYPGSILLLEAQTRKTVGWITSSISANQVEYSWNARSVTLSRTNPAGKDVVPGNYIIQVAFDNGRAPLESASFSLTASGEYLSTKRVSIKNANFVPNTISVKRTEQLIVRNEDAATITLQMNGVALAKLPQWSSYVFNGSAYVPGAYELRIKEQALARMTVTVQ